MPSKTRKQNKKGGAFLLGRSLMAAAALGMLPTAHGNHSHEPHEYHPLHFPHLEHEHDAFNLGSYRVPESHRVVYIQTIPVAASASAKTSGRSKKAKTSKRTRSKKSATRRSKRKAKTA